MSYGILTDATCREVFEEINSRPRCDQCRNKRRKFEENDKKGTRNYSNLLAGFSSSQIKIPIDILIVAEAHGGGESKTRKSFRKQGKLEDEVSQIAAYYLKNPIEKFHQQQMRKLLQALDSANKGWVFTDLIKCYVWHGSDNKLRGRENWNNAIEHCKYYLDEQIKLLKPHKILGLGGTVSQRFGVTKPEHGSSHRIENSQSRYVHSLFPSQWTADKWVTNNGWEKVILKLTER